MDASRWEQIQKLFHEAALLPTPEQHDFLEAACADNKPLMEEVLGLLREDVGGTSLLDQPLAEVAHRVLGDNGSELPQQELGAYRIRKILGEGGMGVVYLAERPDLGSLVALKLLRDAWLSPARRERFAAEQRTLAQLNHPSIGRLYDADTLPDGTPFFVMEYVEGLPLTDYCKQHRSSIEQRLHLFRQVCEAVQYAHSNTVIHRDLKPSNILVKSDGTIRLLDFGIAKQLESLDVPTQQTMTALRLMTPAYASPEQIRGQRVGIQTDVYSLGVILYELVSGELPFDLTNLSPAEAEMVLVSHEPPRPSTKAARHALPSDSLATALSASSRADLDVLCLTAMHKDPERRYRSVEALMRDVDHYLGGEPLEARPDTLHYRASKFVRRNRREVMAAAAALAIVIGLVVFFTVRLARARDAALAEAARTHRIQSFMMSLFQGGDESVGPSDELKVVALVDRGVQEARALDADPKVQIELYHTLGSIYEGLGKFDQAHSLFQSAYDKSKSAFGAESLEVAENLIAFAQLYNDQAEYEEAEKSIREGLAIGKKKLPANHPFMAKATAELGAILAARGEYDQAIEVLNEAARLQSQSGASTADRAANLTELANAHFYRGDYPIADALNKRVLGMDRELYGNRHPNVGEDLINLGALQFQLGHFAEAEQYQRQALDIIQGFFGKDHPETASVKTALGRALVPQGRLDEASEMLHQALATHERVYGPVHPRVAAALIEMGKVAQQQTKFDEAEADFQRAVDIYRKVYAGKHYYIGNALCSVGGISMERKQYVRAEQIYREALQMFAKTLTPEHQLVGIGRVRLGRALLRQQRYTEAEAESRPGYEILSKQATPPAVWMQNVRNDLIEEYDALQQPDKAGKIRAELAASQNKSATTAKN